MKVVSMPHPLEDGERVVQVTMTEEDWADIGEAVDVLSHYFMVGELIRKLKKAGVEW